MFPKNCDEDLGLNVSISFTLLHFHSIMTELKCFSHILCAVQ